MRRPRVICELSAYLGILLRAGLRSGDEGDPGPVLLDGPRDLEGDGPAPSFFLRLIRVVPDRRPPAIASPLESTDPSHGPRHEVRRPPLWVSCRYLTAVRGRTSDEEAEMLAAILRTIHDHPVVSPEHLPSVRPWSYADRFPVELVEEREGWRAAGLGAPRITLAFQATVPIPSALAEPVERVLDREIRIEEMP